ncbi:C2H2 finger domain-containing protein [Phlyctema vagabunda]|uniref:C2H2 finger domain-containing protein n=1 Tax=Phlyctema vagabunda TaxID=108571 RepID=A0ABR4PG06_9HELO
MVGKKKRNHPDIEELLGRPWCYYCERDFDDLKILISHQKAKHFKCERCGRRLNTAGGLSVHMNQVHKETLASVDNSLPNRQGLEVEIFGMEGIPDDVAQAHNQRIIAGFYQAEAERRAATGNPGPGAQGGGVTKKPKFESPSDLKKRLAEHKAKKAEQAAAGNSGGNTPMDYSGQSPMGQSPGAFNGSPYPPPATTGPTQGAGYGSYSQEPYSQPYNQQPPYSAPPNPAYQAQYSPPQQYPPQQSFPPAGYQQPATTPSYPGGPGSFNGYQPPPTNTPPTIGGLPSRPPSLPPAPGLPQRPSFGAPPVPSYQMQQMHQGSPPPFQSQGAPGTWNGNGWNGQDQNSAMSSAYSPYPANSAPQTGGGDDIDAIIRMAEAGIRPPRKDETSPPKNEPASLPESLPAPVAVSEAVEAKTEAPIEKKSKKDKPMKMIYSDNEVSPEERMAMMPRYAFVPDGTSETSLVDAATLPGVAGTVDE